MASASSSNTIRTSVVDVENTLMETNKSLEASRPQTRNHCIYRVPASISHMNSKAYHPQVVSLGPFHHGDPDLFPMEKYKLRAWQRMLKRSGRSAEELTAAVEDVAELLAGAYMDLDDKWRIGKGREKFLEMMIVDGCFLLEVAWGDLGRPIRDDDDYSINDPIFTYQKPLIKRDILVLENQLPLLLLQKLVGVERANPPDINRLVQRMLSLAPSPEAGLGLHPLDLFRRSMVGPRRWFRLKNEMTEDDLRYRSAVELYEAGVRFRKSGSTSLCDVLFKRGELRMPTVYVDDFTECWLRNMMAFELLHVDAGKDVNNYVWFMGFAIDSAKDVDLLISKGIIQNALSSPEEVAKMFSTLARGSIPEIDSKVYVLLQNLNTYSRLPWEMWLAYLKKDYFRSPWTLLSLAAACFLLLMTVLQTVYTMLQFYRDGKSPPSAPCPM